MILSKKNILAILISLVIATSAILIYDFLPKKMGGDEVVSLLVHSSSKDINYPDRELISAMSYGTYLHYNIVGSLDSHFAVESYEKFLLFVYVFLTCLGAYAALRLLKISWGTSILVSVVALIPRMSPGQTYFGVFTDKEVTGRALAVLFFWVLSALNIKFLREGKNVWPVFILTGLFVYIHPVSMIFFAALLFIINFIILLKKYKFKKALKDIFYSLLAFCLTASLLIKDIISNVLVSLKNTDQVLYTGYQYAQALMYRMPWDFYQQQLLWLRHVGITTFIFILFIIFVILFLKKKNYEFHDKYKVLFWWSGLIISLAAFFSFFIPNTELYLVKNFDFPFIIQQSSRIFKFYYLGLFILFAVFLDLFRKYFNSRILFTVIFVVGILSSGIGFEWSQYLMGYSNYQKEYIPEAWQSEKTENKEDKYERICSSINEVGVSSEDLVISYDFDLRYFCKLKLYVTYEEGTFYMMRGKNTSVYWHQIFLKQKEALDADNIDLLLKLAKEIQADYAILDKDRSLVSNLPESRLLYYDKGDVIIIKFNN